MVTRLIFLCFIAVWNTHLGYSVQAQEIELSQGVKASIDLIEQLRHIHGLSEAQEIREELFLDIPSATPNQTSTIEPGGNLTTILSPVKERRSEPNFSLAKSVGNKIKRAAPCTGTLTFEGDDPCKGRENEPEFVPCDEPCKYTRAWFISNLRHTPRENECLFYTAYMTPSAREYARRWTEANEDEPLSTIWDLWPEAQYNDAPDVANPLRCINQANVWPGRDNQVRERYFAAMSETMAYICGGNAVVMDISMSPGGFANVEQDGIFGTIEFPMLTREGSEKWLDPATGTRRVCNRIDAIGPHQVGDTNNVYWKSWWYRGGPIWPDSYTWPVKRSVNMSALEDREVRKRQVLPPEPYFVGGIDITQYDFGNRLHINW